VKINKAGWEILHTSEKASILWSVVINTCKTNSATFLHQVMTHELREEVKEIFIKHFCLIRNLLTYFVVAKNIYFDTDVCVSTDAIII
jgi:hypothetical protein